MDTPSGGRYQPQSTHEEPEAQGGWFNVTQLVAVTAVTLGWNPGGAASGLWSFRNPRLPMAALEQGLDVSGGATWGHSRSLLWPGRVLGTATQSTVLAFTP